MGGSGEEVTQSIHPDNVQLAINAAQALGLTVAGVDLISMDITRPWHENGAIVNEVNFKPYLGGNLENDKLNPYMQALVCGDGRIPVHAVAGDGDLWGRARLLQKNLALQGVYAHICGQGAAESPSGEIHHLVGSSLFLRSRAMLHNSLIDALIIVVDTDEFLKTGLPLDRFDGVHLVRDVSSHSHSPLEQQLVGAMKPCLGIE